MKLKSIDRREDLRNASAGMMILLSNQIDHEKLATSFFDLGVAGFIQSDAEEMLEHGGLPPETKRAVNRMRGVAARRAGECLATIDNAMQAAAEQFAAPANVN